MSEEEKKEFKEKPQENKKLNLKEMWNDKRGKAKIKLALYGIFFILVLIFCQITSHQVAKKEASTPVNQSFLSSINDNYEYDINIIMNDNTYIYHGKRLGNNEIIERLSGSEKKNYYFKDNNYYELDDNGNYTLTTTEEVYPYINYRYTDISFIKKLLNMSTKENNSYKLALNKVVLNNNDIDKYVTIELGEESKLIMADYTELFKLEDEKTNKVLVTISFDKINEILSLEEDKTITEEDKKLTQ